MKSEHLQEQIEHLETRLQSRDQYISELETQFLSDKEEFQLQISSLHNQLEEKQRLIEGQSEKQNQLQSQLLQQKIDEINNQNGDKKRSTRQSRTFLKQAVKEKADLQAQLERIQENAVKVVMDRDNEIQILQEKVKEQQIDYDNIVQFYENKVMTLELSFSDYKFEDVHQLCSKEIDYLKDQLREREKFQEKQEQEIMGLQQKYEERIRSLQQQYEENSIQENLDKDRKNFQVIYDLEKRVNQLEKEKIGLQNRYEHQIQSMHETIQMDYQLKKEQETALVGMNKRYQQMVQKCEFNETKVKNVQNRNDNINRKNLELLGKIQKMQEEEQRLKSELRSINDRLLGVIDQNDKSKQQILEQQKQIQSLQEKFGKTMDQITVIKNNNRERLSQVDLGKIESIQQKYHSYLQKTSTNEMSIMESNESGSDDGDLYYLKDLGLEENRTVKFQLQNKIRYSNLLLESLINEQDSQGFKSGVKSLYDDQQDVIAYDNEFGAVNTSIQQNNPVSGQKNDQQQDLNGSQQQDSNTSQQQEQYEQQKQQEQQEQQEQQKQQEQQEQQEQDDIQLKFKQFKRNYDNDGDEQQQKQEIDDIRMKYELEQQKNEECQKTINQQQQELQNYKEKYSNQILQIKQELSAQQQQLDEQSELIDQLKVESIELKQKNAQLQQQNHQLNDLLSVAQKQQQSERQQLMEQLKHLQSTINQQQPIVLQNNELKIQIQKYQQQIAFINEQSCTSKIRWANEINSLLEASNKQRDQLITQNRVIREFKLLIKQHNLSFVSGGSLHSRTKSNV